MVTTEIKHIAHLVEICVRKGLKHVVISPGSRNAPLIIAFDSHPEITTYVIHDERSAAYFAIGIADELNEPVAITCTSGSAPLNYSPAISEAYYRNIPLLILTADRPIHLIDQGDGQTIRQNKVFHNFVKAEFELPDFPKNERIIESDELVNDAFNKLISVPFGPVHINIPLSEPLYGTSELENVPELISDNEIDFQISNSERLEIEQIWKNSDKKLILIGQKSLDERFVSELSDLAGDSSIAILVENTSNINDFKSICHCIDRTLATIKEEEIEGFEPDLLITIGGAIISKKIKTFFRVNRPKQHWHIGLQVFGQNTFQCLTHSFKIKEFEFIRILNKIKYENNSNFGNKWKQRDFISRDLHNNFIESAPFCDLTVFDLILDTLPDDSNLQMGNSSVVRYCQLFDPVKKINYYSNRGVSGIDGSTSTTVGMAYTAKNKLTVLITGDISFFYDSNALWNSCLSSNLRIIVINNGGGGIFKFIPGPNESKQSDIFFAPHKGSVKELTTAFDLNYYKADSLQKLENVFEQFYSFQTNKRPAILEIDTSMIENHLILQNYFTFLGENK